MNHLFLLWFDTRAGIADTGPYPLRDGRVLLVRDFAKLAQSDFWWSDVAAELPYRSSPRRWCSTASTCGPPTSARANTTPEDYLDHLVGFGLFTTDTPDGSLQPVPLDGLDDLAADDPQVQAQHYRNVAAMARDEMIRCGAYVYFSFLRPFAEVAGVADELDWKVPRAIPEPLYELLAQVNGERRCPSTPTPSTTCPAGSRGG